LITVELHVPFASDFIVEKLEPGDPFAGPVLPLNSLPQYRRDRELGKRVHVQGTVTCQRPGEDVFLQDATGGIQVKSRQFATVAPGDVVEAIGFLDFERFLPVLQDAVLHKTQEPRQTVTPKPVALQELQAGNRHAELITLQGKVLDRTARRVGPVSEWQTGLTLQNTNILFTVQVHPSGPADEGVPVPIGSLVEVSGVCLLEIGKDGTMRSLQVLVPGWSHVRILKQPSWWTPARLLASLSIVLVVLAAALSWILMVSKNNAALKAVIRDKVKAQEELQQAHDLQEQRVAERTAQLKFETTARKEAEVRFKATLAERTRLAQELHDTLEQSLTGIGLQLDIAAQLFEESPNGGQRQLELARNLMTQSQVELRRSIWDLRSRELEEFDLPSAMRLGAQQILEGTPVAVAVETTGPVRALSEVVEENLLRVAQEALTNVIKHAGASEVRISLEFSPQAVTLRVQDNGRGFSQDSSPGPREGHFGLLGMSERAKRLNGQLRVTSTPGSGTCLEVEIPTQPADETDPAVAAVDRGLI
jgi:signal transduction histidine kinase